MIRDPEVEDLLQLFLMPSKTILLVFRMLLSRLLMLAIRGACCTPLLGWRKRPVCWLSLLTASIPVQALPIMYT